MTGLIVPGQPEADPTEGLLFASYLVAGAHQFRPPGTKEWLDLDDVKEQPGAVRLFSGSREFLTSPLVQWPARIRPQRPELEVVSRG